PGPAAEEGGSGASEYNNELRIGWAEGRTLDPAHFSLINDYVIARQVYNGLVRYKPGTTEIEPDLAESWSHSEDGLTYTFHLRQGVQWHKGYGELTAQDVVDHYLRIKDPETGSS